MIEERNVMSMLPRPRELVEKIILETRPRPHVALGIGGCGILAEAQVWRDGYGGGHDGEYMGARRFALTFAHRVVGAMMEAPACEQHTMPQLLVAVAHMLNDGPIHAAISCTTWQYICGQVEICSVGTNSVLVFEGGDAPREVVMPHSVRTVLQRQGQPYQMNDLYGQIATHELGSCSIDDVRIAHIPLLPTTTIAIIADRRLADAIITHAVLRNELLSFIETWTPSGKRIRTCVIISL
jgi:hypothetical protein